MRGKSGKIFRKFETFRRLAHYKRNYFQSKINDAQTKIFREYPYYFILFYTSFLNMKHGRAWHGKDKQGILKLRLKNEIS